MNKLILTPVWAFLTVILISTVSCSSIKTLSNGKKIDERLVGKWEGSEKDKQIKGVEKEWVVERNQDGTYTINFTLTSEGEKEKSTEEGIWWIENNTFFERSEDSRKADSYKYTVLNKEQVKFEMLSTGMQFEDKNYTFIDTKVSNLTTQKTNADGSSVENAIKVKSVPEEYTYIKNNCKDCQFISQALISNKGKYYDLLKVKKSNGEEASYYFDISSFFGKW